MKSRSSRLLWPMLCAACLVLPGCGGSDVGAPTPAPVAGVPAQSSADFVVRVGEGTGTERFVVRLTDPETIETARRLVRGEFGGDLGPHPILASSLRAGSGGFNVDAATGRTRPWHTEPDTARFVDASIEIYDGRPSDIEGDLPYWLKTMGRYTPWGNRFEREIVRANPNAPSKGKEKS